MIACPERSFVYLAYLDDSDTKAKNQKWQVLTAVLIRDHAFDPLEFTSAMVIAELIPEEKMENFQEFHACELYGGYGVFQDLEQGRRFDEVVMSAT